ncbi:MAG TPA: large conductance mechanosensitive channel protein MscL [Dongiaceae bacterium]|jgi:large conductance mechanosensitive channel|nr:large conductance mechanosensitive channel protein MscL [Dongiaceae bacterium]
MLKEFRDFAMRGNVIDLAFGVIIGAAFTGIVNSLVNDVIMPPVGFIAGGLDFSNFFIVIKEGAKAAGPYASLADAKAAGAVTLNYGIFINAVINFLIVAFVLFLVVKQINRFKKKEEAGEVAPPPPTRTEVLLAEIRDELKSKI